MRCDNPNTKSAEVDTDKNSFYSLMLALNAAALKNSSNRAVPKNSPQSVAKIAEGISKLIEQSDLVALMAGLSQKATAGDNAGKNGFYCLMVALNNAARNPSWDVEKIAAVILKLIEKSDSNPAALITGLSEKATEGDYTNTNGFYWLMKALGHAASRNSSEHVEKIAAVISTLIEKSDPAALMAGLSEKATAGDNAGRNGFYWLMAALNQAVFENSSQHVEKIAGLVLKLIEKSNSDAVTALITGLSQKATEGVDAGASGFYCLMAALNQAVVKNPSQHVEKIAAVISKLIEKSDPAALMAGLSEQVTTKKVTTKKVTTEEVTTEEVTIEEAGVARDGFYWLLNSVKTKRMTEEQKKILFSLILSVVIKLNDHPPSAEIKNSIFELKNQLCEPLRKYLETINDSQILQKISAKDTLLGALYSGRTF